MQRPCLAYATGRCTAHARRPRPHTGRQEVVIDKVVERIVEKIREVPVDKIVEVRPAPPPPMIPRSLRVLGTAPPVPASLQRLLFARPVFGSRCFQRGGF